MMQLLDQQPTPHRHQAINGAPMPAAPSWIYTADDATHRLPPDMQQQQHPTAEYAQNSQLPTGDMHQFLHRYA
jgi:hypothetical protein